VKKMLRKKINHADPELIFTYFYDINQMLKTNKVAV